MPKFGFVGGTYALRSVKAECQRAMNCYPEKIESEAGENVMALCRTPGTKVFCTLPDAPVRGLFSDNGRMYAVGGTKLCELFRDGTYAARGTMESDGQPVSIAVNPSQLLVCSSGKLYLLNLTLNTMTTLADPISVGHVEYVDGYFVALMSNATEFRISSLLDGGAWDPTDITKVSLYSDRIVSMLVDHREIWLWGRKHTIVYGDSGNPDFPFEPIGGAFQELGITAGASPARLDNSIYWMAGDERGDAMAYMARGYVGARVSTHAVEQAWRSYAVRSDAIGYAYQEDGHTFWVLYFPTANVTWAYDVASGMWHERSHLKPDYTPEAHRSQCHAFGFSKHLVGDWKSGNVYQLSRTFYDDCGTEIRRERTAPHIAGEQEWMYHDELLVNADIGMGPMPPLLDGAGAARGPQMMLQWSNDAGKTWSNEYWQSSGKAGEFALRSVWRRLGRARDRVYKVVFSDPVDWCIVDAYLKTRRG